MDNPNYPSHDQHRSHEEAKNIQHGHSSSLNDGHSMRSMAHNPAHGHDGHDHHKMMIEDFKKRFWVSLALSVPVILFSPMLQHILGYSLRFTGDIYLSMVLSSVIYFYGGWPFLNGLKNEIKDKKPGMMTLIGVAITVAYLYSVSVVLGLKGMDFFWELVTLIDIMLIGHWMEMKSVLGASKALEVLVNLMPSEAHLVKENGTLDVKTDALKSEDVILIKPGEKVPADGLILEGESYLNESMLTGESTPVKKSQGENVIGGSVNGNGALKVKVLYIGKDSYLQKVIRLVNEAQQAKSKTQNLADTAAKWLTYISVSVGLLTLVIWLMSGYEIDFAIERMVTVMVISCPHALGLAIPLVVAISTALSAQNGLLIRNRTAFENSRRITSMVFDKTGTLTIGNFGVRIIKSISKEFDESAILMYAAGLEQNSEHPIAVGILARAKENNIAIPQSESFRNITGKGAEAIVNGKIVKIVSPGMVKELGMQIPEDKDLNKAETVVYVIIDDILVGYISLSDEVRKESADAVRAFKANGIKVYMATGDNRQVAEAVSKQLKLDGFYAEVLPHDKVEIVKNLQAKGEFVSMTGDGVNDAPALAQADVGIAVGSGTDVAAETADIILVNSNPDDILRLILFGKATYNKMIQNLIWATGYNIFAIPLAAGVLYKSGIMLSPAIGAIFMSLSTVVVALNAQLLKKGVR